LFKTYVAILYD